MLGHHCNPNLLNDSLKSNSQTLWLYIFQSRSINICKNYHDIPAFINNCLFHGCSYEIHSVSYCLITLFLLHLSQLRSRYIHISINALHFFTFSSDLISIMLKGLMIIRRFVNGWVSLLNFHFFMHFSGWI